MHRVVSLTTFLSVSALFFSIGCGAKSSVEPADDDTNSDSEGEGGSDEQGGSSSSASSSNGQGGASSGKGGASSSKGGASSGAGGKSSGTGGKAAGGSSGKGGGSSGTTKPAPACSSSGAWSTDEQYGQVAIQGYLIRNNFWNQSAKGAGSQTIWTMSSRCWGVDAQHTDPGGAGAVKGYPDIARGWVLGTDGGSSLAIQVSDLNKGRIHWSMQAPTSGRTWALWDIYFHETKSPAGGSALAPVNLMIQQRIVDDTGWMQKDSSGSAWTKVTIDGITFRQKLETTSVSSTRNRIQLYIDQTSGNVLGMDSMTLDLKAVIDHYVESGQIKSTDWLTSIQAGYEVVAGGTYVTTDFWTALNDEKEPN